MTEEGFGVGQIYGFVFVLIFASLVLYLAKRKGFFRLPPKSKRPPLHWGHLVASFGSYLFFAIFIVPIISFAIGFLVTSSLEDAGRWVANTRGWISCISLVVIFLWFFVYSFWWQRKKLSFLFWPDKKPSAALFFKNCGMGAVGWLVSYPTVLVVGMLASFLSYLLFGSTGVEQVAVKQLEQALEIPALFACMTVAVIIFVPFVEEFLFRGLLQTWFKRHMPRGWAIGVSSFIFAGVHFSVQQKTGNFELLLSLFALSCFIGFLYERQRTLWASIAFHGIFNGLSTLMLVLSQA